MTTHDLVTRRNKKVIKKYLPLYYNWMAEGLPGSGLCNVFGYFEGMDE